MTSPNILAKYPFNLRTLNQTQLGTKDTRIHLPPIPPPPIPSEEGMSTRSSFPGELHEEPNP